jgi:hypothetical protein
MGLVGVTVIETSVAGVTLRVTPGLITLPRVAVIVDVPTDVPVARPCVPDAFEIVAALPLAAQVTDVVRFCVVLSVYVPVAANCWVRPLAMLEPAGVTAIETSVAGVTLRVTPGLITLPRVAVIVDVPTDVPVASPCVPDAFEIVAALPLAAQVTDVVRFCVVLSV